jgi:hypothetical protein
MDWKLLFSGTSKGVVLKYFNSISKEEIAEIKNEIGVTLSGSLLELLKETNGIRDERDYYLYSSSLMIERYKDLMDYLILIADSNSCKMIFFANDGCGNEFGYKCNNDGTIESEEVGVYYPMENKFKIVAPDLKTWAKCWYSGELGT